uniref:Uncharacterized protein n=1 Tax=Arundo donax TaxID=35708 RepID=A0A0A9ALM6_ARUDO
MFPNCSSFVLVGCLLPHRIFLQLV